MKKIRWIAVLLMVVLIGSTQQVYAGQVSLTAYPTKAVFSTAAISGKRTPFKLSANKVVFNKSNYYSNAYIYNAASNTSSRIRKASSSEKSVCIATVYTTSGGGYVMIRPKNAGKAVVTVTDTLGRKAKVKVTVARSWKKENFKSATWMGAVYYSSKTASIYGQPGSTVTLRISGDKYTKKIPSNSNYLNIALNRHYKVGTSYKAVIKRGRLSKTFSGTVRSNTHTNSGTIWSCRCEVPVTAYNLTAGDIITLSIGGRNYVRRIYSDTSYYSTTFYAASQCRYYRLFTVTVKNKYGQLLSSTTRYLNW